MKFNIGDYIQQTKEFGSHHGIGEIGKEWMKIIRRIAHVFDDGTYAWRYPEYKQEYLSVNSSDPELFYWELIRYPCSN